MIDMHGIYTEEHGKFQIDLRKTIWSKGDLKSTFETIGSVQNDADWMFEEEACFILVEFKNWDKGEMPVNAELFYQSIARKYYGSAYYLYALGVSKPINFLLVLAAPFVDEFMKNKALASIRKRLPFELQKRPEFPNTLIECFDIYSVSDWNEAYPMYPISNLDIKELL